MATQQEDLNNYTVDELKDIANEEDISLSGASTKADIIKAIKKGRAASGKSDSHPEEQNPPNGEETETPPPVIGPGGPPPPIMTVEDFPPADFTKPILDLSSGKVVTVLKLQGDPIVVPEGATAEPASLFFVENGPSQEWLAQDNAPRKFASDCTGQVWYSIAGIMPTDRLQGLIIDDNGDLASPPPPTKSGDK